MAAGEHRVEIATPSDALSIAAFAREIVDADTARSWGAKATKEIANPNANVVVVREGDGVVACGIMDYTDSEARLLLLAVAPKRQRKGIGNALLSWLEATAFVAGVETIVVEVKREDSVARRFYRGAGYRKEHIDRSTYRKSLNEIRIKGIFEPPLPRGRLKLRRPRK